MSFWTRNPYEIDAKVAESLSHSPSGGRLKMLLLGVGLALIPIYYGIRCLQTGHATFFSSRGAHLDLTGSAAVALAVAYFQFCQRAAASLQQSEHTLAHQASSEATS